MALSENSQYISNSPKLYRSCIPLPSNCFLPHTSTFISPLLPHHRHPTYIVPPSVPTHQFSSYYPLLSLKNLTSPLRSLSSFMTSFNSRIGIVFLSVPIKNRKKWRKQELTIVIIYMSFIVDKKMTLVTRNSIYEVIIRVIKIANKTETSLGTEM